MNVRGGSSGRSDGQRRPPRRKRVVLADRSRARTRPIARTIMDLEEQTSVGEALVRHLVRVQLRASLLLTGVTVLVLCGLPALFWAVPRLAAMTVFGVRIPWLVLGVLPFPFLILMGYLSTRAAERHERDFVHLVES